MHELSLALEVCRMAEETAGSRGAGPGRVVGVGVEVGADAGIEIENFRFCLGALLDEPPFRGARADLIERPGDVLRLAYVEVDDDRPDH